MKYFRANCGDASGMSEFWEYYEEPDFYSTEDAAERYKSNNPWVHGLDTDRVRVEELTVEQYKTGLQFNRIYENYHDLSHFMCKYNLFCTKDIAVMFCNKEHRTGFVRIGYPNAHNVYKINQDGNFIFVYHYDGVLC